MDSALPTPLAGSALDYALRYAKIGWYVFPIWGAKDGKCACGSFCKSPGKHPVETLVPRGQNDATLDLRTIHRWWTAMPEAGIGIHLTPSNLVAVDIDPRNGGLLTMERIEAEHGDLVSDVLAYTQGGGEHRVFSLPSDSPMAMPGKLGEGVDVKRNGYIAVEPTRGVSGVYAWEMSSDPLNNAIPSPLPDWLRDLANHRTVDMSYVSEATRSITPEQVNELRDALRMIPADDRDTWVAFGMALRSIGQTGFNIWDEWSKKSTKYNPVDSMRVWRSVNPGGAVNIESIFFMAQQGGWLNPLAGGAPAPIPVAALEELKIPVYVPPVITAPFGAAIPGVLGEVEAWINATSRKPQPLFAAQAALAFGSVVLGRRFVSTQRNWTSLYFLNIGKSASGKEHAKTALEHLLEACDMPNLIGPSSYTSDSAIMSELIKRPCHIAIIDEFGKVIETSNAKNNVRGQGLKRAMMEAWGRCDGVWRPMAYSTFGMSQADQNKLDERTVRNPALSLLAMTTPETFYQAAGSGSVQDGFLNRFLIVETDIGRQASRHVQPLPVPDGVIAWANAMHAPAGIVNPDLAANMTPPSTTMTMTPAALAVFADFEAECIELMDANERRGLAEMFGRSNEIAMRLALIVSLSCGAACVDKEHAAWAVNYVRSNALRTADRLASEIADSEFQATRNQVINLVRKAGDRGMTERDISTSSRRFSALDQRGQSNVMNSLAHIGDVVRVELASASGRGRKRIAWVAVNDDNADDTQAVEIRL